MGKVGLGKLVRNPLVLALAAYLVSVIIIAPWANFTVNDDWEFLIHVRYFSQGMFTKNVLIDSSFVLQGLVGLLWSKVFGISFVSFRVLTIIFTCIFSGGLFVLLRYLKVSKLVTLIALITVLFNPLVYNSSLSFMTEIYFLTFMVWSMYFFTRFLHEDKPWLLLAAAIIGGASILIRQFGLVLFVAYVLVLLSGFQAKAKAHWLKLVLVLVPFVVFAYVNFTWPQAKGTYKNSEARLLSVIADVGAVTNKFGRLPLMAPYFAFFLSPFILGSLKGLRKKPLAVIAGLSLPLAYYYFRYDIFGNGNVLHVEGLYLETDFRTTLSLFDNTFFKLALAYYVAVLILLAVYMLVRFVKVHLSRFFEDKVNLLLALVAAGMLGIIYLVDSSYDRYFLNALVVMTVLLCRFFPRVPINRLHLAALALLVVFSYIINYDFISSTKAKWHQAALVSQAIGTNREIYVNGSFTRFVYVGSIDNPKKVVSAIPMGLEYRCFVQRYIRETPNLVMEVLRSRWLNNKYLPNPRFPKQSFTRNLPNISSHYNEMLSSEEYFSPLFWFIGRRTYIGSYCLPHIDES